MPENRALFRQVKSELCFEDDEIYGWGKMIVGASHHSLSRPASHMGYPSTEQGRHSHQGHDYGRLERPQDHANLCSQGRRRSSRGDRLSGLAQPLASAGGSGFKALVKCSPNGFNVWQIKDKSS